jgi:hypothetical protein
MRRRCWRRKQRGDRRWRSGARHNGDYAAAGARPKARGAKSARRRMPACWLPGGWWAWPEQQSSSWCLPAAVRLAGARKVFRIAICDFLLTGASPKLLAGPPPPAGCHHGRLRRERLTRTAVPGGPGAPSALSSPAHLRTGLAAAPGSKGATRFRMSADGASRRLRAEERQRAIVLNREKATYYDDTAAAAAAGYYDTIRCTLHTIYAPVF